MLTAALWHRIFRLLLHSRVCLASPPHLPTSLYGCSSGCKARAQAPADGAESGQQGVEFTREGATACWLHARNARVYGSSWALLCCGLASKRLLHHVVSFAPCPILAQPSPIPFTFPTRTSHFPYALGFRALTNPTLHPSPTHHQGDSNPISLHLSLAKPLWTNSVLWFLSYAPALPALRLSFGCHSLIPLIHRRAPSFPSSALTSLHLTLSRRARDDEDLYVPANWKLNFLAPCTNLHSLSLGLGAWRLDKSCVKARWMRSLRSLTLEGVDPRGVCLKALADLTPQLHDFTFCEPQHLQEWGKTSGPVFLALDFPNARRVCFRFLHHELKLKLSLPAAFHTFSACAEALILNCSSSAALSLEQLLLYSKESLRVSSFDVASVRALYLNAPIKLLPSRAPQAQRTGARDGVVYNLGPPPFSWAGWLRALAPTVEVLITRHDINLESIGLAWPRLRSLGVVVESDFDVGGLVRGEITVEEAEEAEEDDLVLWKREKRRMKRREERRKQQEHIRRGRTRFHAGPFGKKVAAGADDGDGTEVSARAAAAGSDSEEEEDEEEEQNEYADNESEGREGFPLLPFLDAPNLHALFFPTRYRIPASLLGEVKARYPLLALFCVAWDTWYWERKGRVVEGGGPVQHRRQPRGAKKAPSYRNGRKTVRDKMHSVNGGLVAGYSLGEEEGYMVNKKQWSAALCDEDMPEIELPEPDAPFSELDDRLGGEEDEEDSEDEWVWGVEGMEIGSI
ncbi:unnamed protein product [Closterium sp. Naga37s-1]|nr:unnamed protein product [Closterium sp. Naga37s-1]